jgi:hypothetical protein
VRMELEKEENQVIKWRGGHQKGLGWLSVTLDIVGGMYSKAFTIPETLILPDWVIGHAID